MHNLIHRTCLIFAPNRQNTFHKFVDMAKLHFECMIVHDYDMETWEKHLNEKENNPDYDEDIHYPLLLKLKKRTRATVNDFCKIMIRSSSFQEKIPGKKIKGTHFIGV